MKSNFFTSLVILAFVSSQGWSGVGGIGGGSSGRQIEYSELIEILKARNLEVQMPQFSFAGDFPGTHFIYIDGVCHTQDNLETIKPFLIPSSFGNESNQNQKVYANLKSSRIIKTQDTKGAVQTALIPLEHEVQIFKTNGSFSDDRSLRTFVGSKRYTIPECKVVRK